MNSIRTKLLLWYIGSLVITSLFFWYGIHEFMLNRGIEIFVILVVILSSIGFIIIFRFVQSISNLTNQIKKINDENLDRRVRVKNESTEIAALSKSFNEMLSRINIAFKREQQFIADMAHELKTPLATMKSSLELSLQKKKNTEYAALLKEVNRLSDTLKDVLDLAWTESSEAKMKGDKVHLSELVQDLAEIAEKIVGQKKLVFHQHIESGITVHGYKDKLARALLNLIDNAIKYTYKGSISISLKMVNDSVVFTIQDTGLGIAKEDCRHIFTRFYRGKKTDNVLGSGLGLAIAKSIIELHGGTIEVESAEGKGSRFTVALQSS